MKFKIKKILIVILFVISLVINILSIRSTLAKYQELVDTDYQVNIRKWLINVNENDIQDEEMLMSTVLQPTLIENEHMKEGVIVPGREGYFEIDLDYTKVDVPFTYTFDVQHLNTNPLLDFEFYGYSIVEEGVGFELDNVTNVINYIGLEEGTGTETVDTETGNKTLEVVQTIIDAETGVERKKVITATLTTPVTEPVEQTENAESGTEIVAEEASETEVIEEGAEDSTEEEVITEEVIGKVAQVTEKIVDVTTGDIIEEEKILFKIEQKLVADTEAETQKMVFAITEAFDPIEVDRRYHNLRVYFRWKDTEDNQMDNLADTQYRGATNPNTETDTENTVLKYQASLKFKQYIQE